MEISEQKMEINLTQFEGTSDEIAEQIFKAVIYPMLQQMNQQDKRKVLLHANRVYSKVRNSENGEIIFLLSELKLKELELSQ